MNQRLVIVTPVRNEVAHVRRVIEKMVAQERPPDLWVVVDDGSTDGTSSILDEVRGEVPFMRVLSRSASSDGVLGDRLAVGAAAVAFNFGVAAVAGERFDFIGKVDGDIGLPAEYFRRLLEEFAAEPLLGLAGGTILELAVGGQWRQVAVPNHHVPGALKLYRRECFERIGGVQPILAWDTIDEMYARMQGYTTRSFRDLDVLHYKPTGAAAGVLRGKARHGACAWITHYPTYFVVLRALKLTRSRPLLSGPAFLYGYAKAALTRVPRVQDEKFKKHVRRELAARLPLRIGGKYAFWT